MEILKPKLSTEKSSIKVSIIPPDLLRNYLPRGIMVCADSYHNGPLSSLMASWASTHAKIGSALHTYLQLFIMTNVLCKDVV